jgi:hypothetical protein
LPEGRLTLPVGLDGVYRIAKWALDNKPAALRGSWKSENEFALTVNTVSGINCYQMKLIFQENSLTLQLDETTGLVHETIQGTSPD